MDRFGIKSDHWLRILDVLRANDRVLQVLLFGSRAKGNFKPGSDIDLCLKGGNLDAGDILSLRTAIDALDLPWQVDLAHYESITDQALINHIDRVGINLSD